MRTTLWAGSDTFTALRVPSFRWLWLGGLANSATFQMSGVAQGWLVYQLTGSALALAWVSTAWAVSILAFSPYGGVFCDRAEKRDLLVWMRLLMALNVALIGFLVSAESIRLWHLVASSFASGILLSFAMPAQEALVSELVGEKTVLNALALNSIGMGLTGIVAAYAAGVLIDTAGVASAYYVMAICYLAGVLASARLPRTGSHNPDCGSAWFDLKEGMAFITRRPILLGLLAFALAQALFAMPYRTLMPVFAQEVMGFGGSGLGLLMAAPSLGALPASLAVAAMGDFPRKGWLVLSAGLVMGASLTLVPATTALPLVLLFLAALGAAGNVGMVSSNALLQSHAGDRHRGRVMSVYMMTWALMPLGTLPGGALADVAGVSLVLALQGLLMVGASLLLVLLMPAIRRL